jgi:hypothetical protein
VAIAKSSWGWESLQVALENHDGWLGIDVVDALLSYNPEIEE